jgi:RHS repeat-associated protein
VPSYLTADHLGSTRLVTNASGGVISRHDYLPFGEEIAADKGPRPQILGYANAYTDGITQKFTGKERDTDTIVNVLDYFGARYFSSNMGRWTTPDKPLADQDPDDRQSWNMYGYVRDNPLRHIDPDGEGAWDLMKGFAEGSYNFARHAVVGTVAALATVMSAPTAQAGMAEVLVPPVVNAVDDYRAGGVGGRLLAQGEQGAMAVVTEAVLTGGATAYALKGSIESVSDSLAGKGAPVPRVPPGENQAAIAGRTAHADFAQKVKAKPAWQSQPSLTDPATGKTVKPDAVTPTGRPLELKPKTTSGRAAGRRELPKYERATDKKGRVIYYEQK